MSDDLIHDIEVIDGSRHVEGPVVILDAETARMAIERGELVRLVNQALAALELSGKQVVVLKATP